MRTLETYKEIAGEIKNATTEKMSFNEKDEIKQNIFENHTLHSEEESIVNEIIETGTYKVPQFKLFPIAPHSIGKVLKAFDEYMPFKIALGTAHIYDVGCHKKWDSVIALPRGFMKELKFKFLGGGYIISVENPEILEAFGVILPEINGKYKDLIIHANSYDIKECVINNLEQIPSLGWWSYDYSGYGSFIKNPFSVTVNDEYIRCNIRELGFTAQDVLKENIDDEKTWQWRLQKLFLEEKVLPFLKGKEVTIADGSYRGRPLGIKRGVENTRNISPENIEDIGKFAGLGTVLKKII